MFNNEFLDPHLARTFLFMRREKNSKFTSHNIFLRTFSHLHGIIDVFLYSIYINYLNIEKKTNFFHIDTHIFVITNTIA